MMLGRVLIGLAFAVILTGCEKMSPPVSVDESTEAFVKRVIESGNGQAGF